MKKFLKFWGTRGSCSVSGPEYAHFGGNTCCLEVRYDDTLLIIDAGTGIRPLGQTLSEEKKIDLFLSHTHWDHIIGFPFFEPIYHKNIPITIWAPEGEKRSPPTLFNELFAEEFFPIRLQNNLSFQTLHQGKPIQIGPLTLEFHPTCHPSRTYCFKIKTPHQTISYVTDNEIDPPPQKSFIDFHKHSDLFIHEAQYFSDEYKRKAGWGHSSLTHTIELIKQVDPAQWFVTHHDPSHADTDLYELEKVARALLGKHKIRCPVQWLPDGHTINLK